MTLEPVHGLFMEPARQQNAAIEAHAAGSSRPTARTCNAEGGRVLGVDIDADRLSATQALIGDGITTLDADLAAPARGGTEFTEPLVDGFAARGPRRAGTRRSPRAVPYTPLAPPTILTREAWWGLVAV